MTAGAQGKTTGRLNGTKTFCTNGHYADFLVVIAVTDRAAHTHGLSLSSWKKGRKVSSGEKENKLACGPATLLNYFRRLRRFQRKTYCGKEG